MGSIFCPKCERRLTPANPPGPMTCDGCSHAFDPSTVRWRKPHLLRRLLGWFLILVAALSALQSAPLLLLPIDESRVAGLIGHFSVPFLLFLGGRALAQSRLVEDPAPPDAPQGSPPPGSLDRPASRA